MRLVAIIILCSLLASCTAGDEEKILGKWHSDDFWFEFHENQKYSGGRAGIPMQKEMPYALDPSEKRLTFYTDKENESYYLVYEFVGTDTLVLTNSMNKNARPAKYYRKN